MIAGVLIVVGVLFLVRQYQLYNPGGPNMSSQAVNLQQSRTMTGSQVSLNVSASLLPTRTSVGLSCWHTNQAGGSNAIQPGLIPANKATIASWYPTCYAPPTGPVENQWSNCGPVVVMRY